MGLWDSSGLPSIAPMASPAPPPMALNTPVINQHQINSYRTVLNLSTPQQRTQMLQQLQAASQSDPRAHALLQGVQGYNVKQPTQGQYHNSFATNLTNYAESGGIGKTGYDMLVKPFVDQAGAVNQRQAQINAQHSGSLGAAVGGIAPTIANFGKGIADAGYSASPLKSAVNLFSGAANTVTQAAHINHGSGGGSLLGEDQSFQNQAAQNGILPTIAGAGLNVLNIGTSGLATPKLGEHLQPHMKSLVDSYKTSPLANESGHIGLSEPLGQPRHEAGAAIDGVNAGGRFRSTAATDHPTEEPLPTNAAEAHAAIIKAQDEAAMTKASFSVARDHVMNDMTLKPADKKIALDDVNMKYRKAVDLADEHVKFYQEHAQGIFDKVKGEPLTTKHPSVAGTVAAPTRETLISKLVKLVNNERGGIDFNAPLGGSERENTLRQMEQEYADHLRNTDKENGGVTRVPGEDGKQLRKSTNSPFYSEHYKKFGKAPTKAAYLEEAKRQLATGKDDYAQAYQATKNITDPGEIADALGMSKEDVAKAEAKKINTSDTIAEKKAADQKLIQKGIEGKTPEQLAKDQARMDAINSPTRNQVDLKTGEGGIKSAIANSQQVEYHLTHRAERAFNIGKKLSAKDKKLAYNYEQGQAIEHLSKQADDPARFKAAMTALEDYYDYRLAAERAAGAQVPRVANYLRHYWDLSDPVKAEEFANLVKQSGLTQFKGVSSQPRIFRSYAEGKSLGFTPKNKDVFGDLANDVNQSRFQVGRAALKQGVIDAGGDNVSTKGTGVDAEGKPFVNSNIDGLNGFAYSKDIAKQLKGYNALDRNIFGKSYDKLNSFQKNVVLSLSFFHSLNISMNFAGSTGFRHPFIVTKGLGQSGLAYLSPKYSEHLMGQFEKRGVTDWALKNGVSLGNGDDIAATGFVSKVGGSKFNPIAQGHKAMFQREIPVMALHMAEIAKNRGIEAGSETGIKLGQEINNVMGLLNRQILSRDPNFQKNFNRLMLAPSFTESKFRTLFDAATKWGGTNKPAGNLARSAVVGKTALAGLTGIIGGIIATGQFPTLQQVIGQTIDPYIPTNIKNKQNGTKGAYTPHTFISELSDPVSKLLHGDTSGVVHYANARLSPNLSTGSKLLSNQDYFGNPIFDTSKPLGKQIIAQAAKQVAPIGVQNLLNMTGKNPKGLAESALDEAGFRVKNDPNNPINAKTNAFFKAQDEFKKSLNQNELALFNKINPQKKDSFGNEILLSPVQGKDSKGAAIAVKNPLTNPSNYGDLLAAPDFLGKYISYQRGQGNHDPLWDLPQDQIKSYMQAQVISKNDPGGDGATVSKLYNNLPQDFFTKRDDWFKSLAAQGVNLPQQQAQAPKLPDNLQGWMDNYVNMSASDKKAALNTPAGAQYKQYQTQKDAYNEQLRSSMGLPSLNNDTATGLSFKTPKASGGRKGRIASIPKPKAPKKFKLASAKKFKMPKVSSHLESALLKAMKA